MNAKLIFLSLLISLIYGCSRDESDPIIETSANLTLNIAGMQEIVLENTSGTAMGSNYESGFRESAEIIATNSLNDVTVTINLVDNTSAIGTKDLQPGETISIDPTMSVGVYATLNIDNGTIYEANSGTISISFYDYESQSGDKIIVSGSFNVSDGNQSATGTFSNIKLNCTECGG